jgi:sugar-specific transcriptional regulator TrmB
VLENAGLITRGREAQWRPCRLNPEQLKAVDAWLDDYRRFWKDSFDRLDEYLQELKADRNKKQPEEKPRVQNSRRKR